MVYQRPGLWLTGLTLVVLLPLRSAVSKMHMLNVHQRVGYHAALIISTARRMSKLVWCLVSIVVVPNYYHICP